MLIMQVLNEVSGNVMQWRLNVACAVFRARLMGLWRRMKFTRVTFPYETVLTRHSLLVFLWKSRCLLFRRARWTFQSVKLHSSQSEADLYQLDWISPQRKLRGWRRKARRVWRCRKTSAISREWKNGFESVTHGETRRLVKAWDHQSHSCQRW